MYVIDFGRFHCHKINMYTIAVLINSTSVLDASMVVESKL